MIPALLCSWQRPLHSGHGSTKTGLAIRVYDHHGALRERQRVPRDQPWDITELMLRAEELTVQALTRMLGGLGAP